MKSIRRLSAGLYIVLAAFVAQPNLASAAPRAPKNLTATAGNSVVTLSWSAVSGATSYNVYLGTASGGEGSTPIATFVTGTTYMDTAGITNGTTYYYEVAAVATGVVGAMSSEVNATPSSSDPPMAFRANDFLNTIGVNTHMNEGVDNPSEVQTAVSQIGFRHIRDAADGTSMTASDYISFYQQTGVTFDTEPVSPDGQTTLTSYLQKVQQMASGGALLSMEGPNEPNNSPVTWNSQTSSMSGSPYFTPVAEFQNALYSQAQSNTTLADYPVFGISEPGAESNDVGLQWLIIPSNPPDASTLDTSVAPVGTEYSNYANLHNYVDGVLPNCGLGPNDAWYAEGTTSLANQYCNDGPYVENGITWNNSYLGYTQTQLYTLPRVTTETGWSDYSTANGGDGLTDAQIGRNYMDLLLDATKEGWSYTFIYDLFDEGDGYAVANTNGTLKTSGTYLANFITILADSSSNFTPGTLDYSVPNEPDTVHDMLLQKSNGTFYVAVWDEETIGSGTTDTVTVDLGGNYNVAEYDPTQGTSPIKTLKNVSTVTLTGMSESPILLELSAPTSISLVQAASGVGSGSTSSVATTFGSANTAGDLIVASFQWYGSTTVKSVTDSAGNTYAQAAAPSCDSYGDCNSIWYASNIKAKSSNKVTVKLNASETYFFADIAEFSGVSTLDKTSSGTGTSTTPTTSYVTTTAPDEVIVSNVNYYLGDTVTAGSGFTLLGSNDMTEFEVVSSAGSYDATATLSTSTTWVIDMATFH